MIDPWSYFLLFLKASLFSFSGFGNLPMLHTDLIGRHWAVERDFAESLAVGQVSPGPNGLWVLSLGYLTDGLRGALLALAALTLPPMLVLLVLRFYRSAAGNIYVEGFIRGLSLAVIGIFVDVLVSLLHSGRHGLFVAAMVASGIALAAWKRIPVAAIVALAAVAGILFVPTAQ